MVFPRSTRILTGIALVLSSAAFAQDSVPLKEAKLNIEHNATDGDTGFQGFVDSEGWEQLVVKGPGGEVASFRGRGTLRQLGLTELFFESVEPENVDTPIEEMLSKLPEGEYTFEGTVMENGEKGGRTIAKAWLSHVIPEGPKLTAPAQDAEVPAGELTVSWSPVTKSIKGEDVKIISYQLTIEKDEEPHQHMIGKLGLSMYLPATVTQIQVPRGLLEPATAYRWEVLAIEESGNQTLSSSAFRTK
jgi:hypothetical protein